MSTFTTGVSQLLQAITGDEGAPTDLSQQFQGDRLLKWLDLSQTQVAALLGVSPQAISKAIRDEGFDFLKKDQRAQRIFSAMLSIGGDRYGLPIVRLKEVANLLGLPLESSVSSNIGASDLYASADEIWVISDNPVSAVDWTAMKAVLFADQKPEREKVMVFFLSTLEGAENWVEALEREAYAQEHQSQKKYTAYVFVVVSNLTNFSGEYVITNPGSRCMGMLATTKPMGMYYWNGISYSPANPSSIKGFVQSVHRNELGIGSFKAHFFPAGDRLPRELLDFPHKFIDGIIGKLGSDPVGGVLRDVSERQQSTVEFNSRRKYTPAFLLTYKRKPGDSRNTRTDKIVQEEQQYQEDMGKQHKESSHNDSRSMVGW